MNNNNFLIVTIVVLKVFGFFGDVVHARQGKVRTVGVPVVAAYAKIPQKEPRQLASSEPLLAKDAYGLDTQVLLGDRLRFIKTYKDEKGVAWSGVELLDQPAHHDGVWSPKICFVQKQQLCFSVDNWQPNARIVEMIVPVYAKPHVNALRLGMLSMGTPVRVVDGITHGWAKVMLASGVFGYVAIAHVVNEKSVRSAAPNMKRAAVVAAARKFEKTPYRWGGCSGFNEHSHALTGVDCSGLIYLAFRAVWLNVPRDAQDQFVAAFPVKSGKSLLPGDLVFLAKINQEKKSICVDHVMMVTDNNYLIESTGFGCMSSKEFRALPEQVRKNAGVRLISSVRHKRLGKSLAELWHGQVGPEGDVIFLGTFLGDRKTHQQLIKGLIA